MKTSVSLADSDLARLIDSDDEDVRVAAQAASSRLAAPMRWPELPAHVAALVADVLAEAHKSGRLIYRGVPVSYCHYCGAKSEWKRPPRKKREHEHLVSGVEVADRFVIISRHISVGGCRGCFDAALPTLRGELSRFPVQLPQALQTDKAPRYRRWDRVRCKKCGWTGHEGQLGKLRTLMADGDYPGKCPSCGDERRFMGPNPFEQLDGFDIVEAQERAA